MLRPGGIAASLLVFALASGGAASAQPVRGTTADDDDIVVTAGKMGATLPQNLPMAVTAISGATIATAGGSDIRDLVSLTPNLQITQNASFAQIYIRGIGSNNVFGGSDPSVAVHIDGVHLGRPVAYFASFIDVERVEILRGPQPTLYGRNTIGGTINIISRTPGDRTEAEARLTAGNYGLIRGETRIAGAIRPGSLAGSLALLGTRRSAYRRNIVSNVGNADSERTFGARGQLRWTIRPRPSGCCARITAIPTMRSAAMARYWSGPPIPRPMRLSAIIGGWH